MRWRVVSNMADPRVAELQALVVEEGVKLPLPIALILWFEDRGYVVDLETGMARRYFVGAPTPSGKAVAHLLVNVEGDF